MCNDLWPCTLLQCWVSRKSGCHHLDLISHSLRFSWLWTNQWWPYLINVERLLQNRKVLIVWVIDLPWPENTLPAFPHSALPRSTDLTIMYVLEKWKDTAGIQKVNAMSMPETCKMHIGVTRIVDCMYIPVLSRGGYVCVSAAQIISSPGIKPFIQEAREQCWAEP